MQLNVKKLYDHPNRCRKRHSVPSIIKAVNRISGWMCHDIRQAMRQTTACIYLSMKTQIFSSVRMPSLVTCKTQCWKSQSGSWARKEVKTSNERRGTQSHFPPDDMSLCIGTPSTVRSGFTKVTGEEESTQRACIYPLMMAIFLHEKGIIV